MADFWLLFAGILLANLILDFFYLKKKGRVGSVPHYFSVMLRGAVMSFNAVWAVDFDGFQWEFILQLIILQGIVFWILFDPLLNLLMGWGLTHKGSTAFLDSIFPNFLSQLVVKAVILGAVIFWMT